MLVEMHRVKRLYNHGKTAGNQDRRINKLRYRSSFHGTAAALAATSAGCSEALSEPSIVKLRLIFIVHA